MNLQTSQQPSSLINPARIVYRGLRGVYRKARAARNLVYNLVNQPVIILLYHRVTDLSADPEMLAVSPENFYRHLKYLKQNFPVLRFDEEWPDNPKRSVAITFDDGYADNVQEALPILKDLEIPATFFISTGHTGTPNEFWWHQLEAILLRQGDFPSSFFLIDEQFGGTWQTESLAQRQNLYKILIAHMKRIAPERQQAWLDQLKAWAGPGDQPREIHRTMTRDEIKKLADSPWASVGAHTQTHAALSALTEDQQRREIFTSKQDLEDITGREVTTFSYPFGRKADYNRTSVELCRQAGFTKAASNFPGQVHRWTDPMQLPRHLVRNWDLKTFAEEIRSFWTR